MPRQTKLVTGLRGHAWVIQLKSPQFDSPDDGPRLAGIFNWVHGLEIPTCLGGYRIAAFETRAQAREARKTLYGYGLRRAVVRKIRGTYEILPERPDQRPARLTAEEEKEDADGAGIEIRT